MSLGLLFPGQGTQHPGMLPWLDAPGPHTPALAAMATRLGADWRERLNDPAWAGHNSVAQPLLTGVALAAWAALREQLPAPRAVAGYSVGELAAFAVAGVFPADQALALAGIRARLMETAAQACPGGLLALHGLNADQQQALCRQHGLHLAIALHAAACVVGGPPDALDRAAADARQRGATATVLNVALSSHTPCMAPAVAPLRAALEAIPFASPHTALVCNRHGHTEHRPAALRAALAEQIAQTVPWETCMANLREQGVRCVLEVGPGNTLARLWQAIHPEVPVRSLDDFQRPDNAATWVRRCLAD